MYNLHNNLMCKEFSMTDYDQDRTLVPLHNSRLTTPLGYIVSNKKTNIFSQLFRMLSSQFQFHFKYSKENVNEFDIISNAKCAIKSRINFVQRNEPVSSYEKQGLIPGILGSRFNFGPGYIPGNFEKPWDFPVSFFIYITSLRITSLRSSK